ncbi:MAG: AraC family transcriptional regulator [Gammaproteobacteria bacterium]|nr:AraC family transcriptional regulator [Gammaproteobacteria bacterium]
MNKTLNKTQTEYARRINNALVFIEQHLDETIRLDDVAKISYFSAYHFHRIFHGWIGETVNEYISRKRMERSATRLVCKPELTITAVAEMGGFSSSANFAKAFKLYFGVTPSELRNPVNNEKSKIGKLYSKYGKAFNPKDLYSQFVTNSRVFDPDKLKELLMKIKVKEMEAQKIACLSSPNGYVLDSVFSTWEKILHWAENKGVDTHIDKRFALCHDNPSITPEKKCRYDAAIVIEPGLEVTSPYVCSSIPAGKYAVAYFKAEASKINNFMTELCSVWFPDSGFEPDNYPPMFNYLNDARKDGYVEMDIYIKLKELEVSK